MTQRLPCNLLPLSASFARDPAWCLSASPHRNFLVSLSPQKYPQTQASYTKAHSPRKGRSYRTPPCSGYTDPGTSHPPRAVPRRLCCRHSTHIGRVTAHTHTHIQITGANHTCRQASQQTSGRGHGHLPPRPTLDQSTVL